MSTHDQDTTVGMETMDFDSQAEPLLKPIAHNCTLKKSTRCAYCELGLDDFFNQNANLSKLSESLTRDVKGKVKESFTLIDETVVSLNDRVEQAAVFVKEEIDLRIESLKFQLDEIRDTAFEQIDLDKEVLFNQLHIDELQEKAKFYLEELEAMSAQVADDKLMKQLQETLEKNVQIIQELFETSIEFKYEEKTFEFGELGDHECPIKIPDFQINKLIHDSEWSYNLEDLCMENYFTRRTLIIENEKEIYKVLYIGEGLVAVAFERGGFSIWNIHTGKHVIEFDGHVNEFYATSDDKLVASLADEPDRVEMWDLKTFESVKILNEGGSEIECFAQIKPGLLAHSEKKYHADRNKTSFNIVVLSYNGEIVTEFGRIAKAHSFDIRCLVGVSENLLASGSSDFKIRIWDVKALKMVKSLRGHEEPVNDLKVLGGNKLVSSSDDGTIRVWDVEKGKFERKIEDLEGVPAVGSILTLPGGAFAAVLLDGGKMSTIRFYEKDAPECVSEIDADELHEGLQFFQYAQNNCFIYWGDRTVKIVDFKGANRDYFTSFEGY